MLVVRQCCLRLAVMMLLVCGACAVAPLRDEALDNNAASPSLPHPLLLDDVDVDDDGQHHRKNGWNLTTSVEMLFWSKCAYCPPSSLLSWTCSNCGNASTQGFLPVFVSERNRMSVLAYAGHHAPTNRSIVAFRGSTDLVNWVADLYFLKLDSHFEEQGCHGCRVHRGFLDAYKSVRDEVVTAVKLLAQTYPHDELWITGHSLGGALAVFCALDLSVRENITTVRTITFGEPRVGNRNWAAFYAKHVKHAYRVVHQNDLVPHLPSRWQGFYHEPTEVWNKGDSDIVVVCNGSGEDALCSDSLHVYNRNIADHLWYLGHATGCGK